MNWKKKTIISTTTTAIRKPVDEHADNKDDKHGAMLPGHRRHKRKVPGRSYLIDHVFGCIPGLFVSQSRVQIGAAAEEKTREGYEDEGLEDVPGAVQPCRGGAVDFPLNDNAFRISGRGR